MSERHLLIHWNDGFVTLCLNRPDQLNALSPRRTNELIEVTTDLESDDSLRCVVLKGSGRVAMPPVTSKGMRVALSAD